ncbi:DUF2238 domain-containing protein [bacterium]|nr:DUF2238 domain-containing protein [bacterium]
MKKWNKILILIGCLLSICYTFGTREIYEILIRISFIPVLLIPTFLRKLEIKISDDGEFIYILFVYLAHFLGSIVELYNKIYFFDTLTHFLSGIVVSIFAFGFLKRNKIKTNLLFDILFVLGMSSLVAVSWEIFEFTCDQIFGKDAQKVIETGVTDTMKDMIVALLGSCLFCISYCYERCNHKNYLIHTYEKGLK